MRPYYTMPAAMGRIARVGYSPRPEDVLPPLGGDIHLYPDTTGLGSWEVPYTTTTGNVFIRIAFLSSGVQTSSLRAYYNGVEVPLLSIWQSSASRLIGVGTFGGSGFPLGTGTITFTNAGGDAGVAVMKVGELRSFTGIGGKSSYSSEGNASGLQLAALTQPGNDIAITGVVAGRVDLNIRPITVRAYYSSSPNQPEIYPESIDIVEIISTDRALKMAVWFGAASTQTLPYPTSYQGTQLLLRWNAPNPAIQYGGSIVEIIGSVP